MLNRGLSDAFLERGSKIFDNHNRFGAGVFELVLKFTRGVQRVHVDDHKTCTQDGGNGHRILRHVGHHDRNAIAFVESQRLQIRRQGQAFPVGLGIADVLAHEAVGRTVCVLGKALLEQSHQGAVLGRINVGWDAFGVTFQPNGIQVHIEFS